MECKLDLTAKKIVAEKFRRDIKGYDSDEVDAFLDRVVQDYIAFSAFQKQVSDALEKNEADLSAAQQQIASLVDSKNQALEDKRKLEIDNASLHKKLDGIKPGDRPTAENVQYISRINQLEDFLYSIGFDPRTLKKRS